MPAPKATTDDILVNLELPKKIIFDNVKIGDLLAQQVVDAIPSLPNKTHLESMVVRADNHPKGCRNEKDLVTLNREIAHKAVGFPLCVQHLGVGGGHAAYWRASVTGEP